MPAANRLIQHDLRHGACSAHGGAAGVNMGRDHRAVIEHPEFQARDSTYMALTVLPGRASALAFIAISFTLPDRSVCFKKQTAPYG